MRNPNTSRARSRRRSRRWRKVRRFIRKVQPIFVLTVMGVSFAIIVFKLIAFAAPLKATQETTTNYGFDIAEAVRIQDEHQSRLDASRNASRDAGIQIANIRTGEEVTEVTTVVTTPMVSEQITSSSEIVTTEETQVVIERPQPTLSAYGPGEVYYYVITDNEKILIAKVVWKEARGESFEGQVAVAATVFNRLMSDDPAIDNRSIYSVITQSGAYASISNVTEAQAMTCMEAVEEACRGYDPTRKVFTNGARFFYAQDWISADQLAMREGVTTLVIGGHTFHEDFAEQ